MRNVSISVDAYVDPNDVLEGLREDDLIELFSRHVPDRGVLVPLGIGDGDLSQLQGCVDRAFEAARAMPDCPQAIKDLLWRIHGRAIA